MADKKKGTTPTKYPARLAVTKDTKDRAARITSALSPDRSTHQAVILGEIIESVLRGVQAMAKLGAAPDDMRRWVKGLRPPQPNDDLLWMVDKLGHGEDETASVCFSVVREIVKRQAAQGRTPEYIWRWLAGDTNGGK